jgi:hypothetical protein
VKKGYLRGVPRFHRRGKLKTGGGPRAYVLTETEIVLSKKGDRVRVALTGPDVVMSREEWRQWLEERLKETGPHV